MLAPGGTFDASHYVDNLLPNTPALLVQDTISINKSFEARDCLCYEPPWKDTKARFKGRLKIITMSLSSFGLAKPSLPKEPCTNSPSDSQAFWKKQEQLTSIPYGKKKEPKPNVIKPWE